MAATTRQAPLASKCVNSVEVIRLSVGSALDAVRWTQCEVVKPRAADKP